jgi:hypothetical protein
MLSTGAHTIITGRNYFQDTLYTFTHTHTPKVISFFLPPSSTTDGGGHIFRACCFSVESAGSCCVVPVVTADAIILAPLKVKTRMCAIGTLLLDGWMDGSLGRIFRKRGRLSSFLLAFFAGRNVERVRRI